MSKGAADTVWLIAAVLSLTGYAVLAWVISVPIAVMVALDASLNFCALCFLVAQLDQRGLVRRA